MSVSIEQFDEFFKAVNKDKEGRAITPFPWQTRLARRVFAEGWPDCIDLPTASGKTACIDVAAFVLACQANLEADKRTVGRRIFFAVNRRVIVDEAFDRAKKLAQKLLDANDGIVREVADALRSMNENGDDARTPPLDVAQLRGGIYRDTSWARSLTQPMVVCTTADQLGSRLLFRGYGVSDSMKPIHAALCGCDSLVLLDEAHVTKAFSQTMQLLPRYQLHQTAPPMRFVQMTATPTEGVTNRFELDDADRSNVTLKERQFASKPATLIRPEKKKSIVGKVVSLAVDTVSDMPKAVGIIVNRVQTAREIEAAIRAELSKQKSDVEVHLVIGRMRALDRDTLQDQLRSIVGPERPDVLDKSVIIVATQCLEVGADYDFDALITECASIDALRQRFGRLNRKGRRKPDGKPINVVAAIVTNDESIKGEDPIYGDAIKHTWEWLWSKKNDIENIDFGIVAFKHLWDAVDAGQRAKMLAAPDAAVLLPAHLDALCQTSPQPEPSPDVSYFIHGPQRDNAEVNLCWRADLGTDDATAADRWPEIIRLLPPTSLECMTVPLRDLRRWMAGDDSKPDRDADVPVTETNDDDNGKEKDNSPLSAAEWSSGVARKKS